MDRKLLKSNTNRVLAGVCAGVANYFGWDTTMTRMGFALLCLVWGSGIILYIVGAVVMPEEDDNIVDM